LLDTSARRGISPSPHLAEDLPRDGQPAAMATADRSDRGRAEARDAKDCCKTPSSADSRGREHAARRRRRAGVVIDRDAGASARIRGPQSRRCSIFPGGTRLLRWSGGSYGIGPHRIVSEKAGVSQIEEPSHRIGFARLRHKKTHFSDDVRLLSYVSRDERRRGKVLLSTASLP